MINEDFIHKYTRRKRGHDYYAPCRYHIILKKSPYCCSFGSLHIPASRENLVEEVRIDHSKLGKIICGNIYSFTRKFPVVKINQYCVMPDHVHIFLWMSARSEKHLGFYIGMLKSLITKEYSEHCGKDLSHLDIFLENYTDKIIYPGMNFDIIFRYIKGNPYRLAIKKVYPKFFQRKTVFEVNGEDYEAYGNLFLLTHPFKKAVRAHRNNTLSQNEELKEEMFEHVAEGGILVSPFVNKVEKEIRAKTEEMAGKYIKLQAQPFGERYSPSGHYFDLCKQGRLLIIAPIKPIGDFGYQSCHKLNDIASDIVEGKVRIATQSFLQGYL